jgi:hypothetical protein
VAFSACKFFLIWAVLWTIVEIVRTRTVLKPGSRLLACLIVFTVAGALFFFRHIWAIDQAESSRVSAAEVFLAQKSASGTCRKMTDDEQKTFDEMKESYESTFLRDGRQRWWEIRAFDSYYVRWVWRQVMGVH